ncbi:hypothetical protein O3G_MSEX003320 [Manduca sexta]|uniref:Uncharacterized protein n=1 Tax=Manduca sexta TaxID=7130 RepID=A0A921YS31_MANSE|nr:hypothetical protein O3G_MSEX003320 [Manduca sexta]
MWKLFGIVFIQMLIIDNISAQYPATSLYPTQPQTRVLNQKQNILAPLLMSFLNKAPMPEKIETVANAINRMPPRMVSRKNKRHEMADFLKQSALQSLMVAANACKVCNKESPVEVLPMRNPVPRGVDMPRLMQYL